MVTGRMLCMAIHWLHPGITPTVEHRLGALSASSDVLEGAADHPDHRRPSIFHSPRKSDLADEAVFTATIPLTTRSEDIFDRHFMLHWYRPVGFI